MDHGAWGMEHRACRQHLRCTLPSVTSVLSGLSVASVLCIGLLTLSLTPLPAQDLPRKGISVGEPPADHSPEAELRSFKVLEGFEVNLFASESDGVANALVIRWDERGRLWCLQTSAYPQPAPGEVCNDKILILEDTNRDGRADKVTPFADGLRMPMGMELAGPGEAYVGEGEKLWLMRDTDGDDRADSREVIFSGFGTGDTHQNINSFIWSPDGALVMHQGLHCYSRVSTPWGVRQLYGAGFWRFWPRSRKLEPYPTGMPQNAWGTAFTKWGQPIMVAGAAGMYWSRPMEISVPEVEGAGHLPYFLLTRFMLPSSGQIIKTEGLRKFCGVDIAGNAHWPATMQEEVIAGGFFDNAIFRYKLAEDKTAPSGFEAIEQPPLITSDNVAFRPVDVRFGPDGALYIADWYNPIIGHYQASFRHPNRDRDHGRIWRVVAKGREMAKSADLRNLDSSALLKLAADGDRWERYQACRLLMGKSDAEILNHPLVERARDMFAPEDTAPSPEAYVAWQMTMSREVPDDALVLRLLTSKSPELRALGARTIGARGNQLSEAGFNLAQLVGDDDPRVRVEGIAALVKLIQSSDQHFIGANAAEEIYLMRVLLTALDHPMDTFLERALWLAVHATAPRWKPLIAAASAGGGPGGFLSSLPPHHLAYLVEKEGSAELLGAVRALVAGKGSTLPPATLRGLLSALVRKGDPADMRRALELGAKDQPVLDDLADAAARRGYKTPQGAGPLVMQLLDSSDEARKAAACRLAGAWRMTEARAKVEQAASATSDVVRAAALSALARLGADARVFEPVLLDAKSAWPVRVAALEAIAGLNPGLAGTNAARHLSAIGDAPTMRAWLAPVLARAAATQAMARALDETPCSPQAAQLALATLTAAGRGDAALTTAFGKILGMKNTLPAYDAAWVNALAAEVKSSGDAAGGKAVFNAPLSGCIACHRINKIGGTIGPELDSVGRGIPLELLIEAVVWPNRQIKEGYVATTLTKKDGARMQGYKVTEANGELHLRDFLTGTVHRIGVGEIAERQEAGSLMPEGLIATMTREQLRDLVAYLASLGR